MKRKVLQVLLVKPFREPQLEEIEFTLDGMQHLVGGFIQAIYPWDDPVALVCDDEGKLRGKKPNRMLDNGDIVAGTFFLCGIEEEDFISLSDELAEKYYERFRLPEMFFTDVHGELFCLRVHPIREEEGDSDEH